MRLLNCIIGFGLAASVIGINHNLSIPTAFAQTQSNSTIQDAQIVFSDTFDSGLEKWQPVRDDGQYWQVIDGKAQATITKSSTITELVPTDEYWQNDWKNYRFSFDMTPLAGADKNVSFGFLNLSSWYELHFVNTMVQLIHIFEGQATLSYFDPAVLENGQTYHIEITYALDHITVMVNNQKIQDYDDWSFGEGLGKIGLKAGTGSVFPTQVQFDNVQVALLTQPTDEIDTIPTTETPTPTVPPTSPISSNLDIPLIKQTNPLWNDINYDNAADWASVPTIGRWGCLLTSLTMIMQYHGLSLMPDGQQISPISLNDWLQSQPDGYVEAGLLNWFAFTRLIKQISDTYQTPSLEYSAVVSSSFEPALSALSEKQPPIIELPEHFLVATGPTDLTQPFDLEQIHDLSINDPYYDYSKLSEHSQDIVSTRLLIPSHTDLSAIAIAHPNGINITIQNAQQETLPVVTTDETVIDPVNHQSMQSQQITQLFKPKSGTYTIRLTAQKIGPAKITILAYDQAANPLVVKLSLNFRSKSQSYTYILDYKKNADSSLETSHRGKISVYQHQSLLEHFKNKVKNRYQTKAVSHKTAEYLHTVFDQFKKTYMAKPKIHKKTD